MNVVEVANFAGGDFREFGDVSWNGSYPPPAGYSGPNRLDPATCISAPGAGPNGGYYYDSEIDDRSVNVAEDGGGQQHHRVHMWLRGGTILPGADGNYWSGCRSLWLSSGYANDDFPSHADEYHVQAGGVAPTHLTWWRDSASGKPRFQMGVIGNWSTVYHTYLQGWVFGPMYPGQTLNPGIEHHQGFKDAGGGADWIPASWAYNRYAHFRWNLLWGNTNDSQSANAGSFEADYYDPLGGAQTTVATQGCLSGTGLGTFTFASAAGFTTGTPITVMIGSELLTGTLSGTTFTVTKRGDAGSAAASHAVAAAISGGAWVNIVPKKAVGVGYGSNVAPPAVVVSNGYSDCRGGRYNNPASGGGPTPGVGLSQVRIAAGALSTGTVEATTYNDLKAWQLTRLGTLVGGSATTGGGGGGGGGGVIADPTVGPYGAPILDTFAGADADPIGGNYQTDYTFVGHQDFKRAGHAMTPGAGGGVGNAQAYDTASTYGPNAVHFYKVAALPTATGQYFDTLLRLTNPNGSYNGVELSFTRNADGTYLVEVYKHEAGSNALVGTVFASFPVVAAQWIGMSAKGTSTTTIEVWTWDGTAWNLQGTLSFSPAASLQNPGYPGFETTRSGAWAVSAWGAGTIAAVPTNTSGPAVTGTASPGSTLTCAPGAWTGSPSLYAFTWRHQDGSPILGANAQDYTVQTGDLGVGIYCDVVAINGAGSSAPASSNVVGPVVGVAPANTQLPRVTGTPAVGATLSGSDGSWTGDTSRARRWQSNRSGAYADISTGPTLAVSPQDMGRSVRLAVDATNAYGTTTAYSTPVTIGAAVPPVARVEDFGAAVGDELHAAVAPLELTGQA